MADIAVLLDELMRRDPTVGELESVDAWWRVHLEASAGTGETSPANAAVLGGFMADRVAYAFASGYVEAARKLLGETRQLRRAFCATEAGGGHPRAIECAFTEDPRGGGRLRGKKSFVTLGEQADELLVVASAGVDDAGRKQLRVARIPADRDGVRVVPLPALDFVPELPHARVELDDAVVLPEELLRGDGYLRALKPFRTVEDVHVHLGLLGLLLRLGRGHGFEAAEIEGVLDLVVTFVALAETDDPLSPALHRALDASLTRGRALMTALEQGTSWSRLPESLRRAWRRDRPLFDLARDVRRRRLASARAWRPA